MNQHSFRDIVYLGEQLYFEKLRDDLEEKHFGWYAVIDVDTKEYVVGERKLDAMDAAKEKFGEKITYIVHIGHLHQPTVYRTVHAWNL